MSAPQTHDDFGCPACRAVPASQAESRIGVFVRNLFGDAHEGYTLMECEECRQPFLEQFQEITWLPGGEDDIWLRWMPLTEQERAEIDARIPDETRDDGLARELAKMMHRRTRLVRDPMGRFAWYDEAWDAGNLYPPG
jgi:hypothetical protein